VKATSSWVDLGPGVIQVLLVRAGGKTETRISMHSDGSKALAAHHVVALDTQLEANVGSDRAWVFRAFSLLKHADEVLATQFDAVEDAKGFESSFKACLAAANASASAPAPSAAGGVLGMAAAQSQSQTEGRSTLKGQRRRLSVVSNNANIEGVMSSTSVTERQRRPTMIQESGSGLAKGMGMMGLGSIGEDAAAKQPAQNVVTKYAGISKKGYAPYNMKKQNQDSMIMAEDTASGSIFFAVYDGHGEVGHHVSRHFKREMPPMVFSHSSFISDPNRAMSECVLKCEQAILRNRSVNTQLSGTTGVMGIVRENRVWCANIGDSRLMLCCQDPNTGSWYPREVSIDHKPDAPEEKKRIVRKGGRVFAMKYDDGVDGPARVWLGDQDLPGLAMSRSLCDEVAKIAGVISNPECFSQQLGPECKIMVLASDGLYEFMENPDVLKYAVQHATPKACVDALLKESRRRGQREEEVIDDTTIVVAFLNGHGS
jgi:serine/threonine protein phosphatase PrpC